MGYYRLLLAIFVCLSHTGLFFGGFDQGQSAVIGFFLISGYVMTLLIDKYYARLTAIPWFYTDRISRIFPQFLLYAAFTLILVTTTKIDNPWTSACTRPMVAGNFAIIPMYFPSSLPYYQCTLLPQSWTLAVELLFYAVVPFILSFWNRYAALAVAAYSLWIYGHAYFGFIDTDYFGFRHLPGVLYIFITGMAFAKPGRVWQVYRWAIWAGAVVLFAMLLKSPYLYALHSNKEILLGLVVGIPCLAIGRRLRSHRLERLAGNLSYGVFLNHYFIGLVMLECGLNIGLDRYRALLVVVSIAAALASFYAVENPILIWRRRLRARQLAEQGTPPFAHPPAFAVPRKPGRSHESTIIFLEYFRIFAFLSVFLSHKFPQVANITVNNKRAIPHLAGLIYNTLMPIFSNGEAGCVMFFFISGFIIAHKMDQESTGIFLLKRIFRIYPLFIAAVLGQDYFYFHGLQPGGPFLPRLTLLGDFTHAGYALSGADWTLRIEVPFYLLAAALTLLPWGKYRYPVILAIMNILTIACVMLPPIPGAWSVTCVGKFTQFFPFLMVGMALYYADTGKASFRSIWLIVLLALAQLGFSGTVLFLFGAFFLVMHYRHRIPSLLWVRHISCITYGFYMIHFWLYDVIQHAVLARGAALAAADIVAIIGVVLTCYAAHFTIEKPGIWMGQHAIKFMQRGFPGALRPRAAE